MTERQQLLDRGILNRAPSGCGGRQIAIIHVRRLVGSMPQLIKAVVKAKGGPTCYWHSVLNRVIGECDYHVWPMPIHSAVKQ